MKGLYIVLAMERSVSLELVSSPAMLAAAPELYTQLRGALAIAELLVAAGGIDPSRTRLRICIDGEEIADLSVAVILGNARAAIARAEGR